MNVVIAIAISSLFLNSCTGSFVTWTVEERGAWQGRKSTESYIIERSLPARISPFNPLEPEFNLYYFVVKGKGSSPQKTALFIPGGPGEFIAAEKRERNVAHFLHNFGYNVVYFHLRGAGLSQFPSENKYDKFLTTAYAVQDVEEIRQDLVRQGLMNSSGKWDVILGLSYGTVLAQQYTSAYERNVDKLILIGPLSKPDQRFQSTDESLAILSGSLRRIYCPSGVLNADPQRPNYCGITSPDARSVDNREKEFHDLTSAQAQIIFRTLFGYFDERGVFQPGVLERAEHAFGSIRFVIQKYSSLRLKGELHRYDLQRFSCRFFQKLFGLRFAGWNSDRTGIIEQVRIGETLRDEILDQPTVDKDNCEEMEPHSTRVLYAMGALDGLNARFVREWLNNGRTRVHDALRKSAGDAHLRRHVNEYISRLGISDNDVVESFDYERSIYRKLWDPADHTHRRPTLVLKGEADPVTIGGQAEYVTDQALRGPRTLLRFPGVGHDYRLPDAKFDQRYKKHLSGTLKLERTTFSPQEVRSVKGSVTGHSLNHHLRLNLQMPQDLDRSIKLLGFGRTVSNRADDPDIVVLIENTGSNAAEVGRRSWLVENEYFSGWVDLDLGVLASGARAVAYGKIERPRQADKYTLSIAKRGGMEGFDLYCYDYKDKNAKIRMLLRNNGEWPSNGGFARWSLKNGDVNSEFTSDPLHKEVIPRGFVQVEPNLSTDHLGAPYESMWGIAEQHVCAPNKVSLGSVLQEKVSYEHPVIILNEYPTEKPKTWKTSDNELMTISLSALADSSFAFDGFRVFEGRSSIVLKNWLEFWTPLPSTGEFRILGYNILNNGDVSLIMENRSGVVKRVGEDSRDWFYSVEAYDNGPSNCHPNGRESRECLIYSFLVMDPLQFANIDANPILRAIDDRFKTVQCVSDGDNERSCIGIRSFTTGSFDPGRF